jgi:hypothetical protein
MERHVPGGPYVNEQGTAQRQIPGGPFINETVSAGGGNSISVPAGSIVLSGFAPTVSNPRAVSIPAGSLVLTGIAPSITNPKSIAMPVGSIRLNGFAPTVTDGTVVPSTIRYDITTGRIVKIINSSVVISF